MAMWQSNWDPIKTISSLRSDLIHYRTTGWMRRHDILDALICAGCPHLVVKILGYLDSQSLLAASLVSIDWQRLLLHYFYAAPKFRQRVRQAIFHAGKPYISRLTFSLDMARAAVVDVAVDDDLNVFVLALLAGRPHVMSCSLFSPSNRRWVHRFSEHFPPAGLTRLAAGPSLVALGSKDGKIHVYESSQEFKCLRLIAVLAHHTAAIHNIVFSESRIVSCSDDMTVGVASITTDGSLTLTKLFHGHVSRVRSIDVQSERILSGSDDRSVKLWTLEPTSPGSAERPLLTLTGHSGPVVGVLLCLPLALSAAGCTVRLWDVTKGGGGACLKLLQHGDSPVTAMTWTSTFRGAATIDASGKMRCFNMEDLEMIPHEILPASATTDLTSADETSPSKLSPNSTVANGGTTTMSSPTTLIQNYSPKQSLKFFSSRDPRFVTSWPDNVIMKLESIPHHFSAFAISNLPLPSVTIYCLDYVI